MFSTSIRLVIDNNVLVFPIMYLVILLILLPALVRSSPASSVKQDHKVVKCGDAIRLKHASTPSYYLNSDSFKWSSGSGQQVITLKRTNSDLSSLWQVQEGYEQSSCNLGKPIQCGEIVRLMHLATKKRLHSHDVRSALSHAQEVSGFGDDTGEYGVEGGDKSDDWQVKCDGEYWIANGKVQLLHVETGAFLRSSTEFKFSDTNCPRCPIVGDLEVSASKNDNHLSYFKVDSRGVRVSL